MELFIKRSRVNWFKTFQKGSKELRISWWWGARQHPVLPLGEFFQSSSHHISPSISSIMIFSTFEVLHEHRSNYCITQFLGLAQNGLWRWQFSKTSLQLFGQSCIVIYTWFSPHHQGKSLSLNIEYWKGRRWKNIEIYSFLILKLSCIK